MKYLINLIDEIIIRCSFNFRKLKKYSNNNDIKIKFNNKKLGRISSISRYVYINTKEFSNFVINVVTPEYTFEEAIIVLLHELGHSLQTEKISTDSHDFKNRIEYDGWRKADVHTIGKLYTIEVSAWQYAKTLKDKLNIKINMKVFNSLKESSLKTYLPYL